MIKYAAVPVLAILAACSAEVDNGEAAERNVIETLSVNDLVVTDTNVFSSNSSTQTQVQPPAQPAQTAAPVAESAATRTTQAEPKRQAKPSAEAAPKPAVKAAPEPKTSPTAEPKTEPEAPVATCTAEHRALGHC